MKINVPFISVIIPCRNEEKYIAKCLDSVVSQDYPGERLEILVVDGMSEDGTRRIIQEYSQKHSCIKLLDNNKKIIPSALNEGIRAARGEIILRIDAHATYDRGYISQCINCMRKYSVDNVGGICVTRPGSDSIVAKTIAIVLSHPFGVGNAYFRVGVAEPKYVDTVPFGCYNKGVFNRIGLFDEDLPRNQDDEFNARLIKSGGKILLVPDIVSYYYARDSLGKLWRMYFQYGYFKPLVMKKVGAIITWRQVVPAFFVGSLLISLLLSVIMRPFFWSFIIILSLYAAANVLYSFFVALKKGMRHLFVLPVVFSTLHFSYGIGYLKGILDFMVLKKHRKKIMKDVPLTR
jgi:glycosyltransferase involved in cell wall biosynthesis